MLTIREVYTLDDHVKGKVRKIEIVPAEDPMTFEPLYSAYTEQEAQQALRILSEVMQ